MTAPAAPWENALTAAQHSELKALLGKLTTESDAFAALGQSLGASATGDEPEERGRAVFGRRKAEVVRLVCGNAEVCAFCSNPNTADATTIGTAVAGGLIAGKFAGVNVLLVACVVVRIGLRTLCAATWATSD